MFQINEDLSIHLTRGDAMYFAVTAEEEDGTPYEFSVGELVRLKVCKKKNCREVLLTKDFPITAATGEVGIFLGSEDTKLESVISKPKDYWYEVELNSDTLPQTLIGYDEHGPKLFRLYPEGADRHKGYDERSLQI